MADNLKENLKETLGRRAEYSLVGKAIIGVIGGLIVSIVVYLKTCHKDDTIQLETSAVQWFNHTVIDLSTTLDSAGRVAHFSKLGIHASEADSIATFIAIRNVGGVSVSELNKDQLDSLNLRYNIGIPVVNQLVFYVNSFDNDDYIVVIANDSLIKSVIEIPK